MATSIGGVALLAMSLAPAPAMAHPMGNMGISHYSELAAGTGRIVLRYVLDFAEIPTFQEIQKHRITAADGGDAPPAYLQGMAAQLTRGISLRVGGRDAVWTQARPCTGRFAPGAAGMHTMRIDCEFSAPAPSGMPAYDLVYRDGNYAQRSGWKEVVLRPDPDMQVASSSVPTRSRSAALTEYPISDIGAPPQVTEARASLRRAAPPATR